ncbi:hypothetical protein HJA85_24830 [Rhizobium bangladeshense]|uniref:hypothetical protein n=1 Tax=Rhizobium bangladeshense TaxID=1138189 RepID=UPI001C82FC6A|nr:hypothetical protein [Rhizobium bangladeshense]MBX4870166.1 hypothetical protein [Rhizobium bangladeshense]
MSRERTPAGNILALARSRDDQARDVEADATSYMPTSLDLDKLMPEDPPQVQEPRADRETGLKVRRPPDKSETREDLATKADDIGESVKRKRISLYLDDDVLTKIFRVSLERHEQLSSATHRLILEALKARGL